MNLIRRTQCRFSIGCRKHPPFAGYFIEMARWEAKSRISGKKWAETGQEKSRRLGGTPSYGFSEITTSTRWNEIKADICNSPLHE